MPSTAEITASVQHVLDADLRPLLHFHGGDVRIADVTAEGKVRLEYVGACHGCQLQVVTHFVTVRQRLLKVEGVIDVVANGVHISEEAQNRIAKAFGVPPSGGIRDASAEQAPTEVGTPNTP